MAHSARIRSVLLPVGFAALAGVAIAQPPVPMLAPAAIPGALPVSAPAAATTAAAADAQRGHSAAEERLRRLRAEVDDLARRAGDAEVRLRARTRALYRLHRTAGLPVEGGFPAMLERVSRLERLERVMLEDAHRYRDLSTRVAAKRAELTRATEAERIAEETLRRAEAMVEAVEAQYGYADLALPQQLDGLPVAPMPTVDVGALPAAEAVAAPTTGTFGLLRGRLGMPVATTLGVRDAVRDDGPGLEFLARPGTTVIAVAEGRVAFAGEYGSYGRMVILDHGDTFYTIYAGFGRVAAEVGTFVPRGHALGETGGGATPAIFFEVRRGTRSLDTRSWVGLAVR